MGLFTGKKKIGWIIGIILVFGIGFVLTNLHTNTDTQYQITQTMVTGTMNVRSTPGTYFKPASKVTNWDKTGFKHFSKYSEEGGDGLDSAPISVQFNDGSKAEITANIKYRHPVGVAGRLALQEDYQSEESVADDLIRQTVTEALKQAATLMKAEEAYSTRRSEFVFMAESQILNGIYETTPWEKKTTDVDGNEYIERGNELKTDSKGNPIIKKESPVSKYQLEIIQFVVKDIDFDQTVDDLIAQKKKAEAEQVVSRKEAEKAKQDAITAEQKGLAIIAETRASEEKIKLQQVIRQEAKTKVAVLKAQEQLDVATLNEKASEKDANAMLILARAEAEKNRLLVKAGLSPEKKAEIDKEIAIGVAAELAKVNFPEMMILGGGSDGGALNPFDAVGLESFLRIQNDFVQDAQ